MGEMVSAYKILVQRPEGKRPCGKPRLTWGDNTEVNLKEIGCVEMNWIHLAEDSNQ
jgi:hypothetical protein